MFMFMPAGGCFVLAMFMFELSLFHALSRRTIPFSLLLFRSPRENSHAQDDDFHATNFPPQILAAGLWELYTHTHTDPVQTEKTAAPENPGSISMKISFLSTGWKFFHFSSDKCTIEFFT